MTLNFNVSFDDEPKPEIKKTGEEIKFASGGDIKVDTKIPDLVESTPFDNKALSTVLDIERAKKNFLQIQKAMDTLTKKATALKVDTKESNTTANEMLIQCRKILNTVDDLRIKNPEYAAAWEFKSGVDKFILSTFKTPLAQVQNSILRPKINQFAKTEALLERQIADKKASEEADRLKKARDEELADRQKQQEKDAQEAIERQAKLDAIAAKEGVQGVIIQIPIVQSLEELEASTPLAIPVVSEASVDVKIKTEHGSAKVESEWICKIVNPDEVPREYCSPDEKKLKQAAKSGIRSIPGCEITEEFDAKVRLSRKK